MDKINVNREELLETLQSNQAAHIAEYEKALQARQETIEERLEELSLDVREAGQAAIPETISFPMPECQKAEYEKAIRKLEMSVDEVIELDDLEFDQLVMDNWGWKRKFAATTASYRGKMR